MYIARRLDVLMEFLLFVMQNCLFYSGLVYLYITLESKTISFIHAIHCLSFCSGQGQLPIQDPS
jgi:hypothetical protein